MPRRRESQRLKYLHINCIGKMYSLGYSVNFGLLQSQENAKFIRMPTYPWQETNLWANDEYCGVQKTSLLLGTPVSIDAEQICWENEIGLHNFQFLKDHALKLLGIVFCYRNCNSTYRPGGSSPELVRLKLNVWGQGHTPRNFRV